MRIDRLPLDCGPALTVTLAAAVPTVETALLHGPGLPLPPSIDGDAVEGALLARVAADAAPRTRTGSQASTSPRVPLAVPALDALLGGGLRPDVITELYGGPAAGKTAVCAAAAARAAAAGGHVLWIASPPPSFPVARVAGLVDAALAASYADAAARRDAVAAALERIAVLPAADGRAAAAALDAGLASAAAAGTPPALLVLDSAASALDGTLGGTAAGAGVASSLARALKAGAAWAHAPALTTVHELPVSSGWGGRAAAPPRPALGEGWRPHAAVRLRLAAAAAAAPPRRRVATVAVGPRTGESAEFDV